jgi:uncharacterized membrane-anchored protein
MKILKCFLVLVAAGQLAIPATMILQRERTLRDGHAYKFRTQPVDPYDAFRGRFVALRLEPTTAPVATNANLQRGATAYVTLAEDPDGFTKFTGATPEPPVGQDYLRVNTPIPQGRGIEVKRMISLNN